MLHPMIDMFLHRISGQEAHARASVRNSTADISLLSTRTGQERYPPNTESHPAYASVTASSSIFCG